MAAQIFFSRTPYDYNHSSAIVRWTHDEQARLYFSMDYFPFIEFGEWSSHHTIILWKPKQIWIPYHFLSNSMSYSNGPFIPKTCDLYGLSNEGKSRLQEKLPVKYGYWIFWGQTLTIHNSLNIPQKKKKSTNSEFIKVIQISAKRCHSSRINITTKLVNRKINNFQTQFLLVVST